MKIVKPSVQIVNPQLYETMLNTVEHAIRNCYHSEDKITEGSAENIIRGCIARGHESVLEFADVTVKLVMSRADLAQITRHRIGTSFCVSGDTILKSFKPGGKARTIRELYSYYTNRNCMAAFKSIKLRSIDDSFTIVPNSPVKVFYNGVKPVYKLKTESGREIKTTINHQFLGVDGWKELGQLAIGDKIWVNGKELLKNKDWLYYNYIVLDKSQKELAKLVGCSEPTIRNRLRKFNIVKSRVDVRLYDKDYIFYNYIELNRTCQDMCMELGCSVNTLFRFLREYGITKDRSKVIRPNDLSEETKKLLNDKDWLSYNYLELNRTRKEVASMAGCCEAILYKAFNKFDIVKPHSHYPNRQPGYGKKGALTDEDRKRISETHKGAHNWGYKSNREELSLGGAYAEAHRLYDKKRHCCEICGDASKNLEIHHIDKNPRHNDINNIKILCSKCHHMWHRTGALGAFLDKVVSIEYIGEEDVYDIEMQSPYHNYVANGIIVHNCVQSQRYVNFSKQKFGSEINVIVPEGLTNETYDLWRASVLIAESAYMLMTKDEGLKAEVARSVLPNCTATIVYMKANMREWRHIFELRTSQYAQADIRKLMTELLINMHDLYPVFFEDLYKNLGDRSNA